MTTGEVDRLENKAIYFLKTVDEKLKPDTVDEKVLFGEINKNALQQMNVMVQNVFDGLIKNMDEGEWGECDDEQKKDFLNVYNKFTDEMKSGLSSLTDSTKNYNIDR